MIAVTDCAVFRHPRCPKFHDTIQLLCSNASMDDDYLVRSVTLVKRSLTGKNLACFVLAL